MKSNALSGWLSVLSVLLILPAGGCRKTSKEKPAAKKQKEGDLGRVDVPTKGKKFEPPVEISQIPDGVWFCDMGTVHYARKEKGNGKCPLCMMTLKQKGAAMTEGMAKPAHDHMGHDHDHDHDHKH